MIDVRPDPAHPRGGFAVLSFEADSVSGDSVSVEVFDLYNERYLGVAGWQPERHAFGPYPVDRSAGPARVVLGPEVVDKLEEFAAVRLTLGELSADVSWPDDIVHSPKAATSDSAIKTGTGPAAAAPAAPIKMKEPEPEPAAPPSEPVPEPAPEAEAPEPDVPENADENGGDAEEDGKSGMSSLVLWGVALLIALGAAAFFFLGGEEPVTEEPAPAPQEPAPPPVAARPDPCSADELTAAAGQGFAVLGEALRGCGGSVSADTALGLVEGAVAEGDADALAFFGTLYDAGQTDPVIEEQIGLTLGDDPARAAEYYARARDAGSTEAEALLTGVCRTLLLRSDTLSVGAREDYCSQ